MTPNEKIERMKELNDLLAKAADVYYNTGDTIMTDAEYDKLYNELEALEEETGIILSGSRTQNVGFEVTSYLPKVRHPKRMLSLDKTKSREELREWLGEHKGFLSWKLDGLTVCLNYRDGKLSQAVTRGNGDVGEDITPNAMHIKGIPQRIPFKGALSLRGEALIGYSDFERVNETLPEGSEPYKNPRNLASGTLRSLDSKVVADRRVNFYAFTLTEAEGFECDSVAGRLDWLETLGFQRVSGRLVDSETLIPAIEDFERSIADFDLPSDGLVLTYDSVSYGKSLGETIHHPRNGMAFKWADETADTTLREIVWSPSRTGLINPIAVFDTVELEGTSVSRASLHNISILKKLNLAVGDTISVYKANMIIPVVGENKTPHDSDVVSDAVAKTCPACGSETELLTSDDGVETLMCPNHDCAAKHLGRFEHFVQRDAMNIVGMAESTIKAFVENGFLREPADFYKLAEHRDKIITLEGFGEKSYTQIIEAVEASRDTELYRVLYSLGIPNIGRAASRLICESHPSADELEKLTREQLVEIDGIGDVLANDYVSYFSNEHNLAEYHDLLAELRIKAPEVRNTESGISGKTFVITGAVHIWKNRSELKEFIEANGGKVASAVSKNTDYLINNDSTSTSGKNKKANELGIAIITEEQFREMTE
ncbi:DNA ligase (NAD+) [Ruminococcus sp. YE71]|uniref:NAD-dependent DNA ligase LigA n=1 Tax=unclassified Ruminococcus TaxID=2608920 RepID=UPI00087E97B5|nr:DNA ligase (NAD+) [Ruminococcus sp. YE78]SFW42116.1 DNA ligase (NAD+) [Ruminococcus sp. YE71]